MKPSVAVLGVVAGAGASGITPRAILGVVGGHRSTLYLRLANLVRDGWVTAHWDCSGIRPVQRFVATPLGQLYWDNLSQEENDHAERDALDNDL